MPKRTPYDNLPLLPIIIADTISIRPYTGIEWSDKVRSASHVDKIEALRRNMTDEQREAFANLCDKACRKAYDAKADWFLKCVRSKGNRGRNQLYAVISHWLSSFLLNQEHFSETFAS